MKRYTRRDAVRVTASALVLGSLAGCSSDSDGSNGDDGDGGDPSATPTTTGTGTPSVDAESLEARTRSFVERLAAGEYEAAMYEFPMTDAMTTQLDADALEQHWTNQTGTLGQFVEVASVEYAANQPYHVTVARARFTDGVQPVRVVYDNQSRIAGLQFPAGGESYSPPSYAEQSNFTEKEHTLTAPDTCDLPAMLTLPTGDAAGDGQVPGVVLVHGSGPHDMDETIGPNKPFKDLAWGLASRGVAALRYDKRTHACDADLASITLDEKVTDDALAALEQLQRADGVDPTRTAVVGHSMGGTVAPRIASRAETVAGAAMLAANARPLPKLVLEQTEYLVNLDGSVTDAEQQRLDSTRETVERVRSLEIDDGEVVLGLGGRQFWADLADYDQVETATALDLPLTVHQGGRDYQVSLERDFGRWKDALGDRERASFHAYEALNHLMMPGEGEPNPNEYFRPNNVDRQVVGNLASWTESLGDG